MTTKSNREIFSSRILNASLAKVYHAFANPIHLIKWWGPNGFSNTFHEFDLRSEGKWKLTMHGPEKGSYENSSIFKTVEPQKLITWTRVTPPFFDMEVQFEEVGIMRTKISFKMIFESVEACEKIRQLVEPKNEENFDRLEQELLHIHI